ncbi:uncharacterized protein BX663DRAFT_40209 [Cokeromyces recurvatus]|uniref:uncharacterized protein n=1 Tax=Cokeromyces recurvatus TaxID=90255 RepID=UPI00221FD476|nr:uncharacterized protein BX663DRAFT_40209 [Cokeromyces recurvatus]KAI7903751.1 hypothetical protein BX663DRAFT_40209 [Cokeromyces recurvatus]
MTKTNDKKNTEKGFLSTPTGCGLLIFFISGLMHDFMIAAVARRITFEMTAFFLIHGIAVGLEVKLRKGSYKRDPTGCKRVVCNLLTLLFFVITGRLFLSPILRQEAFLRIAQQF